MSLNIVHTADFHLGVRFSGITGPDIPDLRRKDFRSNVLHIAEFAVKNNADLVLVAGDVFHVSNPSPKDLEIFTEFLGVLNDANIPVVVIAGNHDQPKTTLGKNPLDALDKLKMSNYYYVGSVRKEPLIVNTDNGVVGIVAVPYISPSKIRSFDTAAKYDSIIKRIIEINLSNMPSNVDYVILTAHLHVSNAKYSDIYGIFVQEEIVPQVALLEEKFDYVGLGHIHLGQKISDKIVYPGSIERISFAEAKEDKSFVFARIGNSKPKVDFVSLPCRPMLKFELDWRGLNKTAMLNQISQLDIPEGALVKLVILLDSTSWSTFDHALPLIYTELIEKKRIAGLKIEKTHSATSIKVVLGEDWKSNLSMHIDKYIDSLIAPPDIKERAKRFAKEIISSVMEA